MFTRHSSVFQIIPWNWSTAKCRRRKSSDTWYYIVVCARLFVSFSPKSKATNAFPNHILKSKARDELIQARKKLLWHVIVKNYMCNVLCNFLIRFESTWRHKIKEQTPQLTLLCCGRTARSSHRKFSIKKLFLKISQYPRETPVLESLFWKVACLKTWNFTLKKTQHRCFPENIEKFSRLLISKNICERLLFHCFNGSLLYGHKASRSRLHDGVRLQGLCRRSSFLFLSRHLSSWTESRPAFENLWRISLRVTYSGLSLSRTCKGTTNLFEIEKVGDRENYCKNQHFY